VSKRPHLIIIMADQLRYDSIGKHTPNIDRLLSESTIFERAYCASPLCVPARGSFFTGRYPNQTGCLINPWEERDAKYGEVGANTPNLYTMLEREWDSWHTGKQHLYTEERFDRSADSKTHWLSLEAGYIDHLKAGNMPQPGGSAYRGVLPEMVGGEYSQLKQYSIPTTGWYEGGLEYFFDGYITQKSLEAIEQRDREKPFLLNAMFLAPHPPLEIPEPWYSDTLPTVLPENVGLWSQGQSPLQLYNLPGYFGSRYSRQDWQEIWRVYSGLVSLLDHCVGQIVEALEAENLYDDAFILFTADHGEMLGSHCMWQKMCMYEESTHVTMGIKSPVGRSFVNQSTELVSHVDVLPTLCDLLEVERPSDLAGMSLRDTIEQGLPIDREHIFIQYDGNGSRGNFQRCLVKQDHKLIVDLFQNEVFFELYDVQQDRQEKYNLAFERQAVARDMIDILQGIMLDTSDEIRFSMLDYDRFLTVYSDCQTQEPHYPLGY
jgi:arylsulfatase A-like enzyme